MLIWPWPLVTLPAATDRSPRSSARGTLLIEAEAGVYTDVGFYNYPGADRALAHRLGIRDLGRRPLKRERHSRSGRKKLRPEAGRDAHAADSRRCGGPRPRRGGNVLATRRECGRWLGHQPGHVRRPAVLRAGVRRFRAAAARRGGRGRRAARSARGGREVTVAHGPRRAQRLLFVANSGERQRVASAVPLRCSAPPPRRPNSTAAQSLPISGAAFELDIDAGITPIAAWTA